MQSWWLDGGPPGLCLSYVELGCGWFDDLFHQRELQAAVDDGWLAAYEAEVVEPLHQKARAYFNLRPISNPRRVLDDPRWADVVEAAQVAWGKLRWLMNEPNDIECVRKLEATYGRIPTPKER
jgi:hypothetical protein